MADDVLIEHDADIAKVTLNMADDGNRVSDPLAVSLAATLRELAKDARAIIFTGAGDDFCPVEFRHLLQVRPEMIVCHTQDGDTYRISHFHPPSAGLFSNVSPIDPHAY